MRIALKRRSAKSTATFLLRGGIVSALLLAVMDVGYLAAQAVKEDPSKLWQNAIAGNLASFIHWRESGLLPAFLIAIVAFIVIALGHFFTFGPKDYRPPHANDMIPWFSVFERLIHAIVLITFIILMLTGLSVTYGRWLGGGSLTLTFRQLHEMSGFVYAPAAIIMMLMWIREMLPASYDLQWLTHVGGYLGYKGALKSGRFNAGQKVWYWIIFLTTIVLVWTGFSLFFQSGAAPAAGGQWASNGAFANNLYEDAGVLTYLRLYTMLHLVAAIPIILMFIVHIYMSALGARGAIGAMINGKFSRAAAMKFHSEAPQLKAGKPAPAGDDD